MLIAVSCQITISRTSVSACMFYVVIPPLLLPSPHPPAPPPSPPPLSPCVMEIHHSRAAGPVVPLLAWFPYSHGSSYSHGCRTRMAPLLAWRFVCFFVQGM